MNSLANKITALLYVLILLGAPAEAENLIDPTQPIGFSKGSARVIEEKVGMPQLNSILIGKSRRLAIIDGKAYYKGDRLAVETQNYEVANIFSKSVVLTKARIDSYNSESGDKQIGREKSSNQNSKYMNSRLELKLNSQGVEEN